MSCFRVVGKCMLTNRKLKMKQKLVAFKQCKKCCQLETETKHRPNCLGNTLAMEETRIMHKLESGHVMSLLFIAVDERNHFVIGMDYMAKGSVEQFIKDKGLTLTGITLFSLLSCLKFRP